jgi:hypothetical protein
MTAPDVMAALCKLGVEIDPVAAKLVVPPLTPAQKAELADLRPLVALHRVEILAEVVEPWACEGCDRVYYVPFADAREFPCCCLRECPIKRGA